jgi:ribonuclease Z
MLSGGVSLQVLGSGAFSSPGLVLCSDNERLLFDCGDGTQRLCVEHGVKVAKCARVYLTRSHPETTVSFLNRFYSL